MNAKNCYLGLLLVGCSTLLLSSCEKDVYDSSKVWNTTDLVVPDGFDWAMTRNVSLSMESPCATSVTVYQDESCREVLAELPVAKGSSSIVLGVPSVNSALWIEYPLKSGGKEVKKIPINSVAATRAGDAGSWVAGVIFPDAAETVIGNDVIACYQPAKDKFGTLMFEDMWPVKGDYDYNDYVVNYNMEATRGFDEDIVHVTMKLKLRAMGGSLPYRLCMQVGHKSNSASVELLSSDVVGLEVDATKARGGNVELLPNTKHVILALTGFDELRKSNGGEFYNTERKYLVAHDQTPEITFTLKLSEERFKGAGKRDLVFAFGDQFAFDYFLQRPDNMREIHLIDYPPTELYKNYDADLGDLGHTNYYCSKDKLVWGLKAPVEMAWTIETKDITTVYTHFADWIVNGGDDLENSVDNKKWYTQNSTYLTGNKNLYVDPQIH